MEGLKTQRREHVFQECERVCDPVLVDYGANEPGKCVRSEAGRLFLHCQHLPSKMRVEMPQSAHHSHLRFLQALSGKRCMRTPLPHPTNPQLLAAALRKTGGITGVVVLFNE